MVAESLTIQADFVNCCWAAVLAGVVAFVATDRVAFTSLAGPWARVRLALQLQALAPI